MTVEDSRKFNNWLTNAPVVVLLAHYFALCYEPFKLDGKAGEIVGNLHDAFVRLDNQWGDIKIKLFCLVALMVSIFISARPADKKIRHTWPIPVLGVALAIFFFTFRFTLDEM